MGIWYYETHTEPLRHAQPIVNALRHHECLRDFEGFQGWPNDNTLCFFGANNILFKGTPARQIREAFLERLLTTDDVETREYLLGIVAKSTQEPMYARFHFEQEDWPMIEEAAKKANKEAPDVRPWRIIEKEGRTTLEDVYFSRWIKIREHSEVQPILNILRSDKPAAIADFTILKTPRISPPNDLLFYPNASNHLLTGRAAQAVRSEFLQALPKATPIWRYELLFLVFIATVTPSDSRIQFEPEDWSVIEEVVKKENEDRPGYYRFRIYENEGKKCLEIPIMPSW